VIDRRRFAALTTGLAAAGALGWTLPAKAADYPPTQGEMQGFVLVKEPAPAPDTPFLDGRDNVRHFTDFKGKTLLVNFWATWCAPCIREMPSLDRLQARMDPERFQLLLVSQDRGGKAVVVPFLENRLKLPDLPVFYDPQLRLGRALGVRGLPSTYVIDPAGNLVGGLAGEAKWDSDDAVALLEHVMERGKL
jgi:thiol-disulfide isomerase/thioredoxin